MRSLRLNALVVTILATRAAWAAGDTTDVSAGRELALNWCAECHLVAGNQDRVPSDGVPTFFSIADHPSTTELGLRVFLTSPHANMPNVMLSREQLDEIVAYILSLRSP